VTKKKRDKLIDILVQRSPARRKKTSQQKQHSARGSKVASGRSVRPSFRPSVRPSVVEKEDVASFFSQAGI
jgi:hypothetical protein